ncbi:cupin domain-containing protein [Halopiger goleimassiliensis]|uniref:cupin domain-containing protein n=1 Tax=Halopiger goleimassiliensis TaxID=1293048 RepID=UPI0006782F9B|nr:cupin domain-containing protein [Halopiger goleimassiliensis]
MVRDYDESAIPTVHNLQDAPAYREGEGITQTVFRGIDRMLGFSVIDPDKPDAEPHDHPYEQLNVLLEGELDFIVGDEQVSLERYDTIVIPPEVEHTSRAVSDEPAVLLAVWPLREDRLSGTEYQTEFRI